MTGARPGSRKNPVQRRSLALVDAIVEAATQLVAKEGSASITTGAVARLAGVSIGSLYQYFPNREAIIAEVAARHVMRLQGTITAVLPDANDVSGEPGGIAKLTAALFAAHRDEGTLSLTLQRSHSPSASAFIASLSQYFETVTHQRKGATPSVAPFVAARIVDTLAIAALEVENSMSAQVERQTVEALEAYLLPRSELSG